MEFREKGSLRGAPDNPRKRGTPQVAKHDLPDPLSIPHTCLPKSILGNRQTEASSWMVRALTVRKQRGF